MRGLLTKLSAAAFAQRFGISVTSVERKRQELGLQRSNRKNWTVKMLRDLPRLTYKKFSAKYDISVPTILRKRRELGLVKSQDVWTAERLALLGKVSDKVIAERLGVSRYTVRRNATT